jgi:hypothetical protein
MNSTFLRLAVALAIPALLPAQGFPPSQRASITQNVAHTRIEIEYGRPVARGRALFGHLVKWDEIWHPGADRATKISIDRDITIEGQPLKAGEYSLWMIPRDGKPWTVIFNSKAQTFHRPYPGDSTDVLRIDVTPETFSHVESMTIDFPSVSADDAVMRIQWGTIGVFLKVKAPYRNGGLTDWRIQPPADS